MTLLFDLARVRAWMNGGRSWLCLAGLGLLSACAGDEGPPPPCPSIIPIAEASSLVQFNERGQDLTDVLYSAKITDLILACEYDDGVIEADLIVSFLAGEGPANTDQRAPITYFVAVASAEKNVLVREEFDVDVIFQGNQRRIVVTEEIAPRIPLKPGENGADFLVYVGFKLTPAQLQYNRDNL